MVNEALLNFAETCFPFYTRFEKLFKKAGLDNLDDLRIKKTLENWLISKKITSKEFDRIMALSKCYNDLIAVSAAVNSSGVMSDESEFKEFQLWFTNNHIKHITKTS